MSAKKDIIKSIVVLTLISLIVTSIMATVNHFTAPVSEANAAARALAARQEIIPDAADFEDVSGDVTAEGVVTVRGKEHKVTITEAYIGKNAAGESLGYIFSGESNGFGGTITVMCGIDADGRVISVQTMDVSSETSTLGGKTANPEYTSQYPGQDAAMDGVDAISGATITSDAYQSCVKMAFAAYEELRGAGK